MNLSLLDRPLVLTLNRAWQVVGHRTVKQALVALAAGDGPTPQALALDLQYPLLGDNEWDFSQVAAVTPVPWSVWHTLPVRPFDLSVQTPRHAVRVPTVVIATQYSDMPLHLPRLSRQAIYERDGGVCQYTGEYVGKRGGNLDHIVPRSRGGRDSFDNLVWAKREVNSRKAARLPSEAGLRLLRTPKAPLPLPAAALLRTAQHRDWRHFLT